MTMIVNKDGQLNKEVKPEDKVKTIEDFAKFDFQPVGQRAVIYFPHLNKRSKGGVIIPDSAMKNWIVDYFDKNRFHLVVAVSPKVAEAGIDIEAGDYVALDVAQLQLDKFFNTPDFNEDTFYIVDAFAIQGYLCKDEEPAESKSE